jgi:transcription antitermination factor NusG
LFLETFQEVAISSPAAGSLGALRWYAVQTRSNFEKIVRADLTTLGVENYFASVTQVHHWKDRKKMVEEALFPGYVFVRLADRDADRLRVVRTNGVVRILGCGHSIEPIPDGEIDSIRQVLSSRSSSCHPHPFIREGSRVRVRRGPLRGVEGWLVRIKGHARLVLSIEILTQSVATEVGFADVEPVLAPRPSRSSTY